MATLPKLDGFERVLPTGGRAITRLRADPRNAAAERSGKIMAGIGAEFSAMVEKEEEAMDNIRAEDAVNKAKLKMLDLVQGEQGFANVKGAGVVGADGQPPGQFKTDHTKRYADAMQEIEKGLSNPRQIEQFRRRSQPITFGYQKTLMGHISSETKKYQTDTDTASIDLEINSAAGQYNDPAAIEGAKKRIMFTVNRGAERNGLSEKARKKVLGDQLTKMHEGVISAMVKDDPAAAEAYYKKNIKEINGGNRDKISTFIKNRSIKAFGQNSADKIMDLGLSRTESLAEARKEPDADKRAEAVSQVKIRLGEHELAVKDATDKMDSIIAETGNMDAVELNAPEVRALIPASVWNQRAAALTKKQEGKLPVHDRVLANDIDKLVIQAYTDPAARKRFMDTDYGDDSHMFKLSDAKRNSIQAQKKLFANADPAKLNSKLVQTTATVSQKAAADLVLNKLFGVKKNTGKGGRSTKHNDFANQFYQVIDIHTEAWAKENPGKKMPASVRNELLSDLTTTLTIEDETLWFDKEYGIDDIPAEDLMKIEADLREDGMAITGKNLVGAYLAKERKP